MYKEIHNLLKIENDNTTFFTNKELKMIDDYINELEAYKYNMDRDYLRLEKENQRINGELREENKRLYKTIEELSQYEYDREEENDNHILIEVLNENGDLKLTKFRNPRAIWQNYDYPDEYTFRDVDIVNVFQLQQENQSLKKENKILRENAEHNDKVVDRVDWENQKLKNQQKEFIEWLESYLKLFDNNDIYEDGSYDTIEEILSKYEELIDK